MGNIVVEIKSSIRIEKKLFIKKLKPWGKRSECQ